MREEPRTLEIHRVAGPGRHRSWPGIGLLLALALARPALGETGDVESRPVEVLVVLTPRAPWSEDCVALAFGKGDPSLASRCRALEQLADEVRAAFAGAGASDVTVLDRGETLRRVRGIRRPPRCPTAATCDVDTARLLAATLVISGRVSVRNERWSALLELRRVADGRVLAHATAIVGSASDLLSAARAASESMLRELLNAHGASTAGEGPRPPRELDEAHRSGR